MIVTNELNKQYAVDLNTGHSNWIVPEGMEIFSTNLTIELVLQKANAYCDLKGFNLDEYIAHRVEYDWDKKEWVIFYQGKVPAPGNHFLIYVDDKTEDIKLFRGQ